LNVNIDDLASAIVSELQDYTQKVTDNVKEKVDIVSQEVNEEIKRRVTFNQPTGKYVKSFRIKKAYEDRYNKRNTWHVVNGEYGLTHLLERGHALKNGGRTRAFPHIKYGEELAKRLMVELSKEAIEDAGR
jgi:hypothetical protein